jgi:hypothetical protein
MTVQWQREKRFIPKLRIPKAEGHGQLLKNSDDNALNWVVSALPITVVFADKCWGSANQAFWTLTNCVHKVQMAVINGEYFWPLTASMKNIVTRFILRPTQLSHNCAPYGNNIHQKRKAIGKNRDTRNKTSAFFPCDDLEVC